MIFTFLISIVFVAELIITIAIMSVLLRWDRSINNFNELVIAISPKINEVANLIRMISMQLRELSVRFVEKVNSSKEQVLTIMLANIVTTLFFYRLNVKFFKNIRRAKLYRTLSRGLSLLQLMV